MNKGTPADPLREALAELVACKEMREEVSRRKQRRECSIARNPDEVRAVVALHEEWRIRDFRAWNVARGALATKPAETAEPLGYISERAIAWLRDPDPVQPGTSVSLWHRKMRMPAKAEVPVYLAETQRSGNANGSDERAISDAAMYGALATKTAAPRGALTQGTIDMLRREAVHPTESAKPAETPAAESDEWLRWDADVLKRNLDQLGAPTDIEGCLLSPWGRVEVLLKETQRSSNATRSDEQTSPSVQPPAPEPPRCACGQPLWLGVVHRLDGPCWIPDSPSIAQRGAALTDEQIVELIAANDPVGVIKGGYMREAIKAIVRAALALSPEDAGKPEVR